MKIGLCFPTYNDDSKMMFSVSCLLNKWPKETQLRILQSQAGWVCNALYPMVTEYMKWNVDFIIVMSNDIAWKPNDICRLIEHNLPVIGGWASGRCPPFHCHVADYYDKEKHGFRIVTNPSERKGVEKIIANGGELLVFRKDVFEKIPPPWFFGTEMVCKDRMRTEDYFFAMQAMKYGVDMYVDWDVKLEHAVSGLKTYNGKLTS